MEEKAQQIESEYSVFKVNKLKDELQEGGLPLSGTKATLIQRLVDNDNTYDDGMVVYIGVILL